MAAGEVGFKLVFQIAGRRKGCPFKNTSGKSHILLPLCYIATIICKEDFEKWSLSEADIRHPKSDSPMALKKKKRKETKLETRGYF